MDILKGFEVSYYPSGKEAVKLVLYFDSGSLYTFTKRSSALGVRSLSESSKFLWKYKLSENTLFKGS